jgi:hypothetical protein
MRHQRGIGKPEETVMRRNHCLEAVAKELRQAGIDFQIEQGCKHPRVCFVLNGRPQLYVIPFSTSTRNSYKDARAGVRRLLRAEGAPL